MDNMVEGMHKYFGAERSTYINVEMLGCINKNAFQWTNQYYIDYSLIQKILCLMLPKSRMIFFGGKPGGENGNDQKMKSLK